MSVAKSIVAPIVALTVICCVAATALAYTNEYTKPLIIESQRKQAEEARKKVFPDAPGFTQITLEEIDGLVDAYKAEDGSGYVFTTKTKGYGGDLRIMTGINTEGKITGIEVVDSKETPGLGSKVGETKFTDKFKERDSDLSGVDSISGATISSDAFKYAVSIAFSAYGKLEGVKVEGPAGQTDPREEIFAGKTLIPITVKDATEAYKTEDGEIMLVTVVKGYYDTDMEVVVGFDKEGKIAAVGMGKNTESKGTGTKVAEKFHTDKFIGKTLEELDSVDAVSGATITSNAFRRGVKQACELYNAAKEAGEIE